MTLNVDNVIVLRARRTAPGILVTNYAKACARRRVVLADGDGDLIGLTHQTATLDFADTATDADLGFKKIRATVAPAPYDAYAATQYRRH